MYDKETLAKKALLVSGELGDSIEGAEIITEIIRKELDYLVLESIEYWIESGKRGDEGSEGGIPASLVRDAVNTVKRMRAGIGSVGRVRKPKGPRK